MDVQPVLGTAESTSVTEATVQGVAESLQLNLKSQYHSICRSCNKNNSLSPVIAIIQCALNGLNL